MKQTEEHLKSLIKYDEVSKTGALDPPVIQKEQIPQIIYCHNFEKAIEKRDRAMERYNEKVRTLKEKVEGLESEVNHLTKEIKKRADGSFVGDLMGNTLRGTKPGFFDNAETHNKKAAKYNAILDVVRRLEDQRERAMDRYNDTLEKHNEAVAEANEKLEELTAEALLVIDDDMVSVMDKACKVIQKLSKGQQPGDLLPATESAFLLLKLGPILEDHIDGNSQRRDFKNSLAEVAGMMVELCSNPQL
ncbi:MAG TPA: hypothetical protein VI306_08570 [Pyrinomonadaceae bacterium]